MAKYKATMRDPPLIRPHTFVDGKCRSTKHTLVASEVTQPQKKLPKMTQIKSSQMGHKQTYWS